MSTPDRIWARPIGATVDWTGSTSGPWALDDPHNTGTQFLASTPAREHAEELLEVMRQIVGQYSGNADHSHYMCGAAKHILSKIDTGENNDQG